MTYILWFSHIRHSDHIWPAAQAWLESRRSSEAWRHKIEAEASRCSCFPASGELGDGDASSITGVSSSTSSSNEEEALVKDGGATEWGMNGGFLMCVQIYHVWIFIPTKMWMNVNGCVYIYLYMISLYLSLSSTKKIYSSNMFQA